MYRDGRKSDRNTNFPTHKFNFCILNQVQSRQMFIQNRIKNNSTINYLNLALEKVLQTDPD